MSKKGQTRIIGGKWKKSVIRFPLTTGLRPTPNSVRETLFNWLKYDLADSICLDLFAGSGAIGFEAASRGARKVVMIEKNPKAAEYIQQNNQILVGKGQIDILQGTAEAYIKKCLMQFDILFLDPPYKLDLLQFICDMISSKQLLRTGANIYIESEKSNHPLSIPASWHIIREKQCGMVNSTLLTFNKRT